MDFRLPDVGEGLEEAEIIEWMIAEGDQVERDQPVVEILTDKSQTQLSAPVAGQVIQLGFAPGDRARVGELLFVIDPGTSAQTGSDASTAASPTATRSAAPSATAGAEASLSSADGDRPAPRPKASPAVRRRAAREGIDLATVAGTGPGGRILATDLAQASVDSAPTCAPTSAQASPGARPSSLASVIALPGEAGASTAHTAPRRPGDIHVGVHPLRGIRRVTATTMATAWREIPHIHGFDEIDASELLAVHRRLKDDAAGHGQRLTILALLVAAVARAVRDHPLYNASIDTASERFTVHEEINVGIAVAAPQGLIVPVLHQVDRIGLLELARRIEHVTTAAREGTITADELRGGTITVTNFGSIGGRFAAPILRPPEVGIVGFGAVKEQPMVVDGQVIARPALPISIGSDHRLIDGDVSTSFQERIKGLLGDPSLLLLGG